MTAAVSWNWAVARVPRWRGCSRRGVLLTPQVLRFRRLAAQVARQHVGEVHCADMERTEVSFAGGKFDLVLCLDVLEHLVDPWAMVDRLVRQQLVPGGTIIVSVPNIRHFKVLLPLVFQGRWDYTDAGHLDRTHFALFHPSVGNCTVEPSQPERSGVSRYGI
jgi:SAM-dependent methyltransferase